MAEYRTVRMSYWTDPYTETLEKPQEKLLYIYLFTCPYANNLGILNVSRRRMVFETGLDNAVIEEVLSRFEKDKKILRDGEAIWMRNFIKNQTSTSSKIIAGLRKLLPRVESALFYKAIIEQYPYLMDSVSRPADAPLPSDDTIPRGSDRVSRHIDTLSNGMDTIGIPLEVKEEEREEEVEDILNQHPSNSQADRAPAPSVGGGEGEYAESPNAGNAPSIEFQELRLYYNAHGRQEAPKTGWQEYLTLHATRQWPGQSAIYAAIDRLSQHDGEWLAGKAPGLAKFFREEWWRMMPRPAARASPLAPPGQTVTERNEATAMRVLAEMEADNGN